MNLIVSLFPAASDVAFRKKKGSMCVSLACAGVRVWCAYVFRYALGRAIVRRQVDTGNLIQYVETRIFWEKQTNEEHRKQKEKLHDSS